MQKEDILRYGGVGLGLALALAYSSVNVSAAGDQCRLGHACNGGTCNAIHFQPGTTPANYFCACGTTPDAGCVS